MSRMVEAKTLQERDVFELANGSAYITSGAADAGGMLHARLVCAHPPDPITFDPPRVELPPEQEVRLLDGDEADVHYRHEGFVEKAFRQEMDRRHGEMMLGVDERRRQAGAAARQREQAHRSWWKKLFRR